MKLTIILILAVIALATSLLMCYSTSKPLREKAKTDALQAAKQKAFAEEAARERTRKGNLKQEVLQIVSDAIANPSSLKGLTAPYPHHPSGFHALVDFVERVRFASSKSEDLQFWKNRVEKQSEMIRDLQAQHKEIQKALCMGQPIEHPSRPKGLTAE